MKTSPQVKKLQRDVDLLRSAVIGLVKQDSEGEYKPEFIEEVLASLSEIPMYSFEGKLAFREQLDEVIRRR